MQVRWTCRFRPGSYDVFRSQSGLKFFSDQKRALREMLRLSKASWAAVAFVIRFVSATRSSRRGAGAAAGMAHREQKGEPVKVIAIETIRSRRVSQPAVGAGSDRRGRDGAGRDLLRSGRGGGAYSRNRSPYLIGKDPRNIEAHQVHLTGYIGFTGASAEMRGRSAIDIALWDILGQSVGLPLCGLLGGRVGSA